MADESAEFDLRGWYPRETESAEPWVDLLDGLDHKLVEVIPAVDDADGRGGMVRFRFKTRQDRQ